MIQRQILVVGSILGYFLAINPASSQIIPDNTTDTSIPDSCLGSCNITGGIVAEQNLFHSFSEFNIRTGESVYFTDPGVTNIFSRVTGSNASEILGTLGVSGGDANLWLLNPNGIIFGAGAALDVSGSFLATTADSIQFGNDDSFSASPHGEENLALLTVDPSALFFNQMEQNHPITVDSGALLTVPSQQNLTLLGGQAIDNQPGVRISNSSALQAPQGGINISVLQDSGKVDIQEDLELSFSHDLVKGDILLSQGSKIDVSDIGGGNISLQGDNITLTQSSNLLANTIGDIDGGTIDIAANNLTITDNSSITSSTSGTGKGADIKIAARESITLIGKNIGKFPEFIETVIFGNSPIDISSTSINVFSQGEGRSGSLKIDANNLQADNGAWILATTINSGNTGNIDINVAETINLDSAGFFTGSATGSSGNVGTLSIDSTNLLLQNGSVISSSTLGDGDGGDIALTILDLVEINQSLPKGLIGTGIFSNSAGGDGAAGNLNLSANNLVLDNGGQLSSASGAITSEGFIPFGGKGGDITINATDSIEIKGISADNSFPSGIVNSTFSNNPAGNIKIHTGRLNLQGEAIISASSSGAGSSGNLTIKADESVYLSGIGLENLVSFSTQELENGVNMQNIRGGLLTNTSEGKAGNTTIITPSLILDNGVLISTSTFGSADGGNIDIVAKNIKVSSSFLASSTTSLELNAGHAGNITIETEQLATNNSGVITTSSAGLGNAGNLKVNASESIKLNSSKNGIPSGLSSSSVGFAYPGNLEVNTKDFIIRGGAKIDASNGVEKGLTTNIFADINLLKTANIFDSPRNVVINAESINITGTSADKNLTSSISSATANKFPASNIEINTSKLAIVNQGEISVSSFGKGKAGNLNIIADSISLNNQGILNATTISGQGGNIELDIRDILTLNNSEIKTDALDIGNGGNISIDTTLVIATQDSTISASALSGQGGNINIDATELFLTPNSQITATSKLGIDGEINIETFNHSDRNNLVKLPEKPIQADTSIVQSCGNSNGEDGVFSYTGRGGLPPNLLTEHHSGDRILVPDFSLPHQQAADPEFNLSQDNTTPLTQLVVEASAWKINKQEKVELVVVDNNLNTDIFGVSNCPFSQS